MTSYDFIYGSKVIAQCQAQINVCHCDEQDNRSDYLTLIGEDISFFTYRITLKNVVKCYIKQPPNIVSHTNISEHVGTDIDDKLITRKRAITWSQMKGEKHHVGGHGHGKQQIVFKGPTFCAKDMGVNFDPKKYAYTAT